MLTCVLSMLFGFRWLMYYNAYLKVECNSTDCFIKLAGPGRYKKINMEIPRHQLSAVTAVKVSPNGDIIRDNVNMNEEWRNLNKKKTGKKKSSAAVNSFKGPDDEGNYLSYAVYFKDKTVANKATRGGDDEDEDKNDEDRKPAEKLEDLEGKEKDLSELVGTFGQRMENGDIRIGMRQFGSSQTHRRVRNMISKLDSFIHKRRQKLTIRETVPANWKAILMVVFGLVGFLISMLLGCFWDETEEEHYKKKEGGPGARRRHKTVEPKKEDNPYGRQIPSRYEVSTMPNPRGRTSATVSRRR